MIVVDYRQMGNSCDGWMDRWVEKSKLMIDGYMVGMIYTMMMIDKIDEEIDRYDRANLR